MIDATLGARIVRSMVWIASNAGRNLVAGANLALPLPYKRHLVCVSLTQLIVALVGSWLVVIGSDLLDVGANAIFSPWGILSYAGQSYFWLATIAVVVVLERRADQFLSLALALAFALLFISCSRTIIATAWWEYHPKSYYESYRNLWRAFQIWEFLVFARVLAVVVRPRALRAIIYTLLYGLSVYALSTQLPQRAVFAEAPKGSQHPAVDVELTYFSQPNLMKQSLYALSPQRDNVVDWYFIGFAAHAAQNVFRREVEQATIIFEQQFNAIGQTISLINNPATAATVPLASRHNLARSIRAVAEKLDPLNDILVVFLSSHGAENATIAVEFEHFQMKDLSATDLRAILDENRVKWRVVIVSACYSGSFIEELASPTTIVISAAAPDRASFGCSNENEWTYFGRAYFEQALRQTNSLTAAFEIARKIVTERETTENRKASLPQISVGEEIEAHLRK